MLSFAVVMNQQNPAPDLLRRAQAQVVGGRGRIGPSEPVSRTKPVRQSLFLGMHTLWVGSLLASYQELADFSRLNPSHPSPLTWSDGSDGKGLATHSSPGSYLVPTTKEISKWQQFLRLVPYPSLAGQRSEGVILPGSLVFSDSQDCLHLSRESLQTWELLYSRAENSGPLRTWASEPA